MDNYYLNVAVNESDKTKVTLSLYIFDTRLPRARIAICGK